MPDKKEPTQSLALVPTTVDDTMQICDYYSKSELLPDAFKKSQVKRADLFLAITFGMDLGFSPAGALRAVTVIRGKPGLAADAMVGLVLGSGRAKFFRVIESSPESATYETCRVGEKKVTRKTFSQKDAKRAGLVKSDSGWIKYPQHMCEARSKSWLARDVYPDVLHGVYSAEELQELEPEPMGAADFSPVVEASVVSEEDMKEIAGTIMAATAPRVVTVKPAEDVPLGQPGRTRRGELMPEPPDDLSTPIDFDIPDDEPTPEPEGDPSKPTLIEQIQQAEDIDALRAVGVLCADVTELDERNALRKAYAVRVKELS